MAAGVLVPSQTLKGLITVDFRFVGEKYCLLLLYLYRLKKNLKISKTYKHLPNQGEKMPKRLGGNIGCKDKNSSRHLFGFPAGSNTGSTV